MTPELEAAIEKDPTDEAAYLVYGDWLQAEGDPRGELIALQAASLRDPGDKNKFGDGMRVGVKDDETGETVWVDLTDRTPVE